MPNRGYHGSGYRYGFNGKEKDPEGMGGGGSTYDYGFRIYNPNLGRFLSVDPLSMSFPWNSTYAFAENKPIWAIDLDGLEKVIYNRSVWFGDVISGYTGCQEGAYLNDAQFKALEAKLISVHGAHFTPEQLNHIKNVTGYTFNTDPSKIQFDAVDDPALHEMHIYGWSEKSKAYVLLAKYKIPKTNEESTYKAKHWLDQWWESIMGFKGITDKGETGDSDIDICDDLNPFWCSDESDDVLPTDDPPKVDGDEVPDNKPDTPTKTNQPPTSDKLPDDKAPVKEQTIFQGGYDENGELIFRDKKENRVNQDGTPYEGGKGDSEKPRDSVSPHRRD